MGLIRNLFGAPTLEAVVRRARAKLATGEFEAAGKLVAEARFQYGEAIPLREVETSIQRAQARARIRELKERVERTDAPHAYEELVYVYLELGLVQEARGAAIAYGNAHPDKDAPHLLLGEMCLQAFFQDTQARDAHVAWQRLRRAAALNPLAIKPRLLLAELCYCVGADHALRDLARELEELAPGGSSLDALLRQIGSLPASDATQSMDGLFERVQADGALLRSPRSWPGERRRPTAHRVGGSRAHEAVEAAVNRANVGEIVLLKRNGKLLAHAVSPSHAADEEAGGDGLVDIARAVSQTVSRYARDLDLGAFRRCTIQGDFGLAAVGELGDVIAGARWNRAQEPQRLWERLAMEVEGSLGGRI